jgi:DNA-binding HxlR family transcriptional regulator
MAKRKSMRDDPCPVARSLDVVGDRWALLIVRDAFDGVRRFSDFQRNLGVARNILADRLQSLTDEGILAVRPVSEDSAYQEYVLTPKGESLFPVVVALRQWGEAHLYKRGEKHSVLVLRDSGAPVSTLSVHDREGRRIAFDETRVKKIAEKPRRTS